MRSSLIDTIRRNFYDSNNRLIFVKQILDSFENFSVSTKFEVMKKDEDGDSILGDLVSEYLNLTTHDSQSHKINICGTSMSLARAIENLSEDLKDSVIIHKHPNISEDSQNMLIGIERETIYQVITKYANDQIIKFYGLDRQSITKPWEPESITNKLLNRVDKTSDSKDNSITQYVAFDVIDFLISCNSIETMILNVKNGDKLLDVLGSEIIAFAFVYNEHLISPYRNAHKPLLVKSYQSLINSLQLFGYEINPECNIYLKLITDITGIDCIATTPGYCGTSTNIIMVDEPYNIPAPQKPHADYQLGPMNIMDGRMCGGMGGYLYFGDCFYKPDTNFETFMDEDEMKLIVNKAINITEDDVREYTHLSPNAEVDFRIDDKAYMSLYSAFIRLRKFVLFSSDDNKTVAQWANLIGVLFTSNDKNVIYMVSLDETDGARKVAQFKLDLTTHTYQLIGEINQEDGEDE